MHRRKVSLIFITRHTWFIFCPQTNIPHTYVIAVLFKEKSTDYLLSESYKLLFVRFCDTRVDNFKAFYRLRVKF